MEHNYDYRTGTIHSTDFRFWEFDHRFKDNLIDERVLAVEMECVTLLLHVLLVKLILVRYYWSRIARRKDGTKQKSARSI